jgi:hypothetical protein
VRRKQNKGNKRILLQLGNNMGGYLFLEFLGLMGCMDDYKKALNQFCNIFFPSLLLIVEHEFNITDFILFC